jgi:hypothetical protein
LVKTKKDFISNSQATRSVHPSGKSLPGCTPPQSKYIQRLLLNLGTFNVNLVPRAFEERLRRAAKALVKAGHVMLKILNISEYLTFQTGGAGRFDFIKHGRAKAR